MAEITLETIHADLRATLARRRAGLLTAMAAAPASDAPVVVSPAAGYTMLDAGQIRYVSPAEHAARYQAALRRLLGWYVAQYAARRQEVR